MVVAVPLNARVWSYIRFVGCKNAATRLYDLFVPSLYHNKAIMSRVFSKFFFLSVHDLCDNLVGGMLDNRGDLVCALQVFPKPPPRLKLSVLPDNRHDNRFSPFNPCFPHRRVSPNSNKWRIAWAFRASSCPLSARW